MTEGDVVIGVVTFRRPDDLRELLPLLAKQALAVEAEGYRVRLLVVDNDPAGSARPVVDAFGWTRAHYAVESTPGIAAARNRVLDAAAGADLLVFIDDDERPVADWLSALLRTRVQCGADVVSGAVVSAFDGDLDQWVRAGNFFSRRRLPTGARIDVAATNNLLIDLAFLRRTSLRFDPAFGLSGGSDTLFTRQLAASGAVMVWCDEAVVTDHVPASRMSRDWVLRRAFRSGNSASRVDLVLATTAIARCRSRLRGARRGVPRLAGGLIRWGGGRLARSSRHEAAGLRTAARGAGMLSGAFGVVYHEYRRPSAG